MLNNVSSKKQGECIETFREDYPERFLAYKA